MSKLVRIILFLAASIVGIGTFAAAAEDFDSYYDTASLSFRRGNYEEALKFYRKANKLKQSLDLECLWGIAQTYNKLGAYKNALDACDQLAKASGEEKWFAAKAWNLRGSTLYAAALVNPLSQDDEKLREAESAFREVLKISPSFHQARYNLGCTLIRLKRVEEGVRELRVYTKYAAVDDEEGAEKARRIIANPRRAVEYFAPDFSIVTLDGAYISSDELRGKVLLLHFWLAGNTPSVNAFSCLSNLAKKYSKEPFVLISVIRSINDDEATWRDFIEQNKLRWTHAFDKNSKILNSFQVKRFPSYILIDQEGIVRYENWGISSQIESGINGAVKKAMRTLADAAAHPKSTESMQTALKQLQDPIHSEPADDEPSTAAGSGLQNMVNFVRLPKPLVEARRVAISSANRGGLRIIPYTLQIQNWASFPDELFASAKTLPPCTGGTVVRGVITSTSPSPGLLMSTSPYSSRIEIQVLDQRGQVLSTNCSMKTPELLQIITVPISIESQTPVVYIQIKDRLTGNMIQSDAVVLP